VKTTWDPPADLVRRLKLRAIREQRKLNDLAAEVLRDGLAVRSERADQKPARILKDKKTGLPVIQCRRAPRRAQELTPERVAEILAGQEYQSFDQILRPIRADVKKKGFS
jgi:hypothetical protein